jgi:hypothetical protein
MRWLQVTPAQALISAVLPAVPSDPLKTSKIGAEDPHRLTYVKTAPAFRNAAANPQKTAAKDNHERSMSAAWRSLPTAITPMIGRRELLSIEPSTPESPMRRIDQNWFASPHVEPDTRD